MSTATVAILATDDVERDGLQSLIDTGFAATNVARTVVSFSRLPVGSEDVIIRQLQEIKPRIALLSIPRKASGLALRAIALLRKKVPETVIFALGDTAERQLIADAMRAGATEFFDSSADADALLDGLARLPEDESGDSVPPDGGKVITVINAKGGCGATTIAVNLAIALQEAHGNTALVDFALIGTAALHLNVRPSFGLVNALENLNRLDRSLLEGFMTQCTGGVHLLAGAQSPAEVAVSEESLHRLFEPLVTYYHYVVVDASSRLDPTVRAVCNLSHAVLLVAEAGTVALLWSAARVHNYLNGGRGPLDKVHLILNRFCKTPGYSDADAEAATDARVLARIPSHGPLVGKSVDKGTPVALQNNSEVGRSFQELAAILANSREPLIAKPRR